MRTITGVLKLTAVTALIGLFAFAIVGCGQESDTTGSSSIDEATAPESQQQVVEVAEAVPNLPTAPDFTLPAANRDSTEISLSQFQGDKPVVLVFYRAYW
ncbi:MAG: redoxin domain-containing protein [Chloroflexi bacterium]|nr:redoxin domain-containing protein [Chloroflexota bacterium]